MDKLWDLRRGIFGRSWEVVLLVQIANTRFEICRDGVGIIWESVKEFHKLDVAGSIPVARSKILHNIVPRSRVVTERSIRVCFSSN